MGVRSLLDRITHFLADPLVAQVEFEYVDIVEFATCGLLVEGFDMRRDLSFLSKISDVAMVRSLFFEPETGSLPVLIQFWLEFLIRSQNVFRTYFHFGA